MRIVQLKRNRLFILIMYSIFVLFTLYIVINFIAEKPVSNIKTYWSESLKSKQVNENNNKNKYENNYIDKI